LAHRPTNDRWSWPAGLAQLRKLRHSVGYRNDLCAYEQGKRQAELDFACNEHRGMVWKQR
jgi:hypothetical protein